MRNIIVGIVTAAVFGAAALSQESKPATEPGATATSASAPAGKKFDLRGAYKPGDSWVMKFEIQMDHESPGANSRHVTVQTTWDVRIDVLKADKGAKLKMKILRFRGKNQVGERQALSDTDNPTAGTAGGKQDSELKLKNQEVTFAVDEAGRVAVADGIADLVARMREGSAAGMGYAKKIEDSMSQWFLYMVRAPLEFLPAQSVAVGDTWKIDEATPMGPFGGGQEWETKVKCALKEIEDNADGKTARIEFTGTASVTDPASGKAAPGNKDIKIEGQTLFDFRRGLAVRSEVQMASDSPGRSLYSKMRIKATLTPAGKATTTTAPTTNTISQVVHGLSTVN